MPRMVRCIVLGQESEGLDAPPHPGEIGKRIYERVSREGWREWLQRLQMIINENQLNTGDPDSVTLIERHMLGFFFDEGDYGGLPMGFRGAGAKK